MRKDRFGLASRQWNRVAPRLAGRSQHRGNDVASAEQRLAAAIRQLRRIESGRVPVLRRVLLNIYRQGVLEPAKKKAATIRVRTTPRM